MGKQSKQLLVLGLILLLLIAGLLGVRKYNESLAEEPEEKSTVTVLDVDKADIVSFSYDYEGVTYSFVKEDDVWYNADDRSLTLNQNSITAMLNRVAPLEAEQSLGEASDISQYGLDEPLKTIQFATAEQSYTIEIGDYNSVSTVYYVRTSSHNAVYTVETYVKTVFDKPLEDLIEEVGEESIGDVSAGDV